MSNIADNIPYTQVHVKMPPVKRPKLNKKEYMKKKTLNDKFWKRKFMQVLEVFHDADLHWNRDLWSSYGISDHEAKIIEKEFQRQKEWRAKRIGNV